MIDYVSLFFWFVCYAFLLDICHKIANNVPVEEVDYFEES